MGRIDTMKILMRYAAFLALYLLVGVLLLEGLLQLGAWVVGDRARHVEARWLTGHTRILALGDSNTYGLYLEAVDSWPMQLERSWNASHPKNPVELLNLGYPGTNSFRVRENLPAMLDKLAPDIVLIMVGFNDFWTPKEQVGPAYEHTLWQRIKAQSRLYRAAVMWQRQRIVQQDITFGSPRPSEHVNADAFNNPANIEKHLMRMDGEAFYLGTRQGEPAKNMKSLGDNLAAMIAMVKARGADVILITYPSNWGFYPHASKWIRKSAEQNGVALLDITPVFVSLCADGPVSCPEDLFSDGHATAKGNALVAKQVSDFLRSKGLTQ